MRRAEDPARSGMAIAEPSAIAASMVENGAARSKGAAHPGPARDACPRLTPGRRVPIPGFGGDVDPAPDPGPAASPMSG